MKWLLYISLAFRETRNSRGKLAFCLFSVALGVASVTTVRNIIFSFHESINFQSREVLGADIALRSRQPLFTNKKSKELQEDLEKSGLRGTSLVQFYSMIYQKENKTNRLSFISAIGKGFPFYGKVHTQKATDWDSFLNSKQAFALVDQAILEELNAKVGDTISIGEKNFQILGFVQDTGSHPFRSPRLAPKTYIKYKDLEGTGLLKFGSRIQYNYMYKSPPAFSLENWKKENFAKAIKNNIQVYTYKEALSRIQRFMERFSSFLSIISLIILLLSGLGIASSMSIFMQNRERNIAIYRNLGLQGIEVFWIYFSLTIFLALLGSLLGILVGNLIPIVFSKIGSFQEFQKLFSTSLEIQTFASASIYGILSGLCISLLFVIIPIYRIRAIPPLQILRKEEKPKLNKKDTLVLSFVFIFFFFIFIGLVANQLGSWKEAAFFTLLLLIVFVAFRLVVYLVMRLAKLTRNFLTSYHIRQGLQNLYRPNNQSNLMITSLGLGMLLISLLWVLEKTFLEEVRITDKEKTPNYFLLDVQVNQKEAIENILEKFPVKNANLSAMITARIKSINGKEINVKKIPQDRRRQTWSNTLQIRQNYIAIRKELLSSEKIVEGTFWTFKPKRQELSVSQRWAKRIGVKIGDRIAFDIEGIPLEVPVTSFRKIRWQSMQANASLLLSHNAYNAPYFYIGSYWLNDSVKNKELKNAILEKFPNISILNINDVIERVESVVKQISILISLLAFLCLGNGLLVLISIVFSNRLLRIKEAMLLKVLGARRLDLRRIYLSEYFFLSILTSLSAFLLTLFISYFLLNIFLDLELYIPYFKILLSNILFIFINIFISFWISKEAIESSPRSIIIAE